MKNYEKMRERISKYDAERKAQHQTVKDALEQARGDLGRLLDERNSAASAGEVDQFTRKNAEVQIKELLVDQMQKQMDQFCLPVLPAHDFQAWKNELFDFTNGQLAVKYKRVQELLSAVETVLNEIDQINGQHGDTYTMLERLTYGLYGDTGEDADGIRYNRRVSFQHRKPDVLREHLQTNTMHSIKGIIQNLVELNQYI